MSAPGVIVISPALRRREGSAWQGGAVLLRWVIGHGLRQARQGQGRTLREVAEAAGVSIGHLSEVERGHEEPSSEVLAAICRALGLELADLLQAAQRELATWPLPTPGAAGERPGARG